MAPGERWWKEGRWYGSQRIGGSTTSHIGWRGAWTRDHLELGASHIRKRVERAPVERLLRLSCDENRTRSLNCKFYRGIEQEDNRFRGAFPSAFCC